MEPGFMTMMVEGNCPFASRSHMKVRKIAGGTVTLALEDDPSNYNAFGLVHAGAICGLAETAAGMAIFQYLDPSEVIVLNTVLEIRFVSMPVGELTCAASAGEEEVLAVLEAQRSGEKAASSLDVEVVDSSGKVVARAAATFRLMTTPDQFKKYFTA